MIDISSNIADVTRHLTTVEKTVIPQASSSALNKTMTTVVKEIKRDVAKDTGLKQKEIAERLTLRKSNKHTQEASVYVDGKWFNLMRFNAKQTKLGIKASAWKKRRLYRGAFIANNGKTVFVRTGKKRVPIRGLVGPNPVVEAEKRVNDPRFDQRAGDRFDIVFGQEFNYRLGRMQ